MQELTSLYEMSMGGVPLALARLATNKENIDSSNLLKIDFSCSHLSFFVSQELYDAMVKLRIAVNAEKQQLLDLKLLWQYASKLMEAAAETAFLGSQIFSWYFQICLILFEKRKKGNDTIGTWLALPGFQKVFRSHFKILNLSATFFIFPHSKWGKNIKYMTDLK